MSLKNKLIKLRENVRYHTVCACQRRKLQNKNFSWLSSNCTGAIITHELSCRFNTPTVNLYIEPKDFIKFVQDLDGYQKKELSIDSILTREKGYPVGSLGDIKIYFVHYHTWEDAKEKWEKRYLRINKDNLFIMMSERDGCTYEDLIIFDHLPYNNKIVLTHRKYPEIRSAVYISGFENENQLGDVFRMRKVFSLTKYYDEFDFVEWLNGG